MTTSVVTFSPTGHRALSALTAAFLAVAGILLVDTRPALADLTDGEALVATQVDDSRAARGLPRLDTRRSLVHVARHWAATMAREDRLRHNPDLTSQVDRWRWLGENVGFGPDPVTVERAFMDSEAHRANVLDRSYTQIGVGIVKRDGRTWVVQVFRRPLG